MWAVGCVLLEMMTGEALWDFEEDMGAKSLENATYTRDLISSNPKLSKYD